MRDLSFLKLPQASVDTVIIFILVLAVLILSLILIGLIREYIRKQKFRNYFFKEAFEKGLSEKEAQIIWEYSIKLGRDPFLALEFKAPFEKVVDLYLRTDPNADEKLVQDMRVKLGFDYVPYFVPLVSTKDIELFQPAKLYTKTKESFEIALFDKDEKFMYWAVIDKKNIPNLVGQQVTISFVRKGDGIYKFEGTVEDIYTESGKTILKIPHTFELTRYQRREYTRVEVEIPVKVGIKVEDKTEWIKGEIVDISAGGAKVCISLNEYESEIQPMTNLTLKFTLAGKELNLKATVVNVYPRRHTTCYGVKFEEIKPDEQKFIYDFVKKEQQKLAQLMVKNRG